MLTDLNLPSQCVYTATYLGTQGVLLMQAAVDYRQERHELDTILASGIFNRAPNLAQVLTYVCAKYFEGAAEQIKEYNIAVDALGRPAQFDQKRDSIVRVEAHRLRKRLREYYEADGADHTIRIDIPSGQYAPRFLPSGRPLASLSAEPLVAQGELASQPPAPAPAPDPAEPEPLAMTLVPSPATLAIPAERANPLDRKSTRLNSSHLGISY